MSAVRRFRLILFVVIAVFLSIAIFGVPHLGIDTSQIEGQAGPCALMPGVAVCTMTPMQHIAAAQSLLAAFPPRIDLTSSLVLSFAFIFGFVPFFRRFLFAPALRLLRPHSHEQEYTPPRTALQELFSSGILNAKTF